MRNFVALLLATSMLTACAVGPNYAKPETNVAAAFNQKAATVTAAEPIGAFWMGFNDPLLTRLVDEARGDDGAAGDGSEGPDSPRRATPERGFWTDSQGRP